MSEYFYQDDNALAANRIHVGAVVALYWHGKLLPDHTIFVSARSVTAGKLKAASVALTHLQFKLDRWKLQSGRNSAC